MSGEVVVGQQCEMIIGMCRIDILPVAADALAHRTHECDARPGTNSGLCIWRDVARVDRPEYRSGRAPANKHARSRVTDVAVADTRKEAPSIDEIRGKRVYQPAARSFQSPRAASTHIPSAIPHRCQSPARRSSCARALVQPGMRHRGNGMTSSRRRSPVAGLARSPAPTAPKPTSPNPCGGRSLGSTIGTTSGISSMLSRG